MSFERTKTFSGLKSSQSKFELDSLINLFKEKEVCSYLEIGARHGDTFVAVMESLPVGSMGVAVDLPGGLWGKSSSVKSLEKAIDHLKQKGYNVCMVLGDSKSPATIQKLLGYTFDAILIDGDHTYDGVSADYHNLKCFVNSRIMCFHDIVGHDQKELVHGNLVEVPRLWEEIKEQNVYGDIYEFVDQGSTMGIGVIVEYNGDWDNDQDFE